MYKILHPDCKKSEYFRGFSYDFYGVTPVKREFPGKTYKFKVDFKK